MHSRFRVRNSSLFLIDVMIDSEAITFAAIDNGLTRIHEKKRGQDDCPSHKAISAVRVFTPNFR
jgi:hypothetical protein